MEFYIPLTDMAVRLAKAGPKLISMKDERGLYLEIPPKGSKRRRLRCWIKGRENRLSLGVYPEISLKEARERRDEARRLIAQGTAPVFPEALLFESGHLGLPQFILIIRPAGY